MRYPVECLREHIANRLVQERQLSFSVLIAREKIEKGFQNVETVVAHFGCTGLSSYPIISMNLDRQILPHLPESEELEPFQVECHVCGGPLVIQLPVEGHPMRSMLEKAACQSAAHDACANARTQKLKAEAIMREQVRRLGDWRLICPAEFQKTINPQAKGYNKARHDMVWSWQYGEIGLRLVGPSGKCKSRFAYQLLGREFKAGRRVAGIMHGEFRSKISALGAVSSQQVFEFVSALAAVDILLMDDLGKGRATPAAEEAFYFLIDTRGKACKPTLYTMNTDLETFLAGCSEEYRQPLLRRIEDKTKLIQF